MVAESSQNLVNSPSLGLRNSFPQSAAGVENMLKPRANRFRENAKPLSIGNWIADGKIIAEIGRSSKPRPCCGWLFRFCHLCRRWLVGGSWSSILARSTSDRPNRQTIAHRNRCFRKKNVAHDFSPTVDDGCRRFSCEPAATRIFRNTRGRPHWSADHKTCVLPVELKPNGATG